MGADPEVRADGRRLRRRLTGIVVSVGLAAACGSTATQVFTFTCTANGTPPPTDCALVQGVARDANGNPLPFLPVKVDSILPGLGPAYLSGSSATAGDGGFTLLVFRMSRFQQQATPDTVTLTIKGYAQQNPVSGTAPASKGSIQMRFSPLGEEISPTTGIVVFTPIPPS